MKQDCVVVVGPGQRLRYLEQEGCAVGLGDRVLLSAAGVLLLLSQQSVTKIVNLQLLGYLFYIFVKPTLI